jgi:hypothetical protein
MFLNLRDICEFPNELPLYHSRKSAKKPSFKPILGLAKVNFFCYDKKA